MVAKKTTNAPASTGRKRGGAGRGRADPLLSVRGERANGAKLAANVANRIVADIAALGWPEGEVLGSETELLDRYGVSRAVFREAVRLVEHQEVARMRRGPGGGLVITAPTVESVMDAVAVYLFYVDADVDAVFDTRLVLEDLVVALAPARLHEPDVVALRELVRREQAGEVEDHRALHALLATFTRNPALEFFVDLLNRVSHLYLEDRSVLDRETFGASAHAHGAIASSVLAGDDGLARYRMRKHLRAEAEYLRKVSRGRIGLPQQESGEKRGQGVAFQVLEDVAAAGWPVGQLLGSEPELMTRYGVSRAVLREAVRVLEHHQVARMRRGPGGGLFVAEPGIGATTEAVALYLHRLSITPAQLFEVRSAVELAVVDLVVERLTPADAAALDAAIEAERQASVEEFRDIGHDLHAVLAHMAGNRVLELLALVLLRLTRIHQAPPPGRESEDTPVGDVTRVHELIVDAVKTGDRELARMRSRKHLRALTRWVR